MVVIEWSNMAERQITAIYEYYSKVAGKDIAKKMTSSIVKKVDILLTNPQIGQIEELLIDKPLEFRYLLAENYKIIYWKVENTITIASVFDCRQNPEKIKKI